MLCKASRAEGASRVAGASRALCNEHALLRMRFDIRAKRPLRVEDALGRGCFALTAEHAATFTDRWTLMDIDGH